MAGPVTSKSIHMTIGDRLFDFFVYTIAALLTLLTLYPMYFVLIASISSPALVSAGKVLLFPSGLNLRGYEKLIQNADIWVGYRNTVLYTVVGSIINLVVNIPAAYSLSRKDLPGRKMLTTYFLIPMFFTGGLIPTYMIVRDFNLLDNFWVMVLPFSVITYYIIVARTFFASSLPEEILEAAHIDGCGNLRFFFQMALPLSKAIIAVIALWSAVGHWNAYFNALIYLRSESLQPLQIFLRNILIGNQTLSNMGTGTAAREAKELADLIKYAIIVISSAPIMSMYPFVQKYFNKGVMIGALKG